MLSQQKDTFFLLGETGYQNPNNKTNIHFGIGIEYFISKKSSFSLRAKYLKTSINTEGGNTSNTGFSFNPYYKLIYQGDIISLPLNYKWESHFILPNLNFFFNTGVAFNIQVKEKFILTENLTPNLNNNTYVNFNLGIGFSYQLNKRLHLLLSAETFFAGGAKTKESRGIIFSKRFKPDSSIFNLGIRYQLGKRKL